MSRGMSIIEIVIFVVTWWLYKVGALGVFAYSGQE